MTFNTTAQFRNTFWSQSQLVDIVNGAEVPRPDARLDAPITRRFVELSADVNGPTLVRIWDAPKSSYAQRFRHSIDPVRAGSLPDVDRQLQRDPESRKRRQHRRKRDVVQLRREYPLLRQAHRRRTARDSARSDQRQHQADLQHRCPLGAVRCRSAVAQQHPDVAFHARAGAGPHLAVRWRHRHVQNRLRRTIQPLQKLERGGRVGARSRVASGKLEQRAVPPRCPRDRTWRVRPTTSTPSRICASCRIVTASRTRSTGT